MKRRDGRKGVLLMSFDFLFVFVLMFSFGVVSAEGTTCVANEGYLCGSICQYGVVGCGGNCINQVVAAADTPCTGGTCDGAGACVVTQTCEANANDVCGSTCGPGVRNCEGKCIFLLPSNAGFPCTASGGAAGTCDGSGSCDATPVCSGGTWSSGTYTGVVCSQPSGGALALVGPCPAVGQTNSYYSLNPDRGWTNCLLGPGEPGTAFETFSQTCFDSCSETEPAPPAPCAANEGAQCGTDCEPGFIGCYGSCRTWDAPSGKACSNGGTCDGSGGCVPPSCGDGIQNQGELGIDCDGPCDDCDSECVATAGTSCDPVCAPKRIGCDGECGSLTTGDPAPPLPYAPLGTICPGGTCDGSGSCVTEPTCGDGIQNQGELGIDCGGPCDDCVAVPYCGDGSIGAGEACDGINLGGSTCAMFPEYTGGTLSCNAGCSFDFSGCTNVPIAPESKVYWADMSGNKITSADFGDTVQLIARGVDSGTFSILEKDIVTPDDEIKDVVGVSSGADLVGTWIITQEDLDKTDDYDGFYFNIKGEDSEPLEIGLDKNNTPMVLSLEGVDCGIHFDEDEIREITIVANDPDDEIEGTVTIYGEVIEFSDGGVNFTRAFNEPGNVQVLVEANTVSGDDRRRVISNVMVLDVEGGSYVDDVYVAACIDKPEDISNIVERVVDFDASTTRGIRVTSGVVDELIPGEDMFSWFWTFYPPAEGQKEEYVNVTSNIEAYKFTATFLIPGVNSAELRVEVN